MNMMKSVKESIRNRIIELEKSLKKKLQDGDIDTARRKEINKQIQELE